MDRFSLNLAGCIFFISFVLGLSGCDSGDIYPKENDNGTDIDVVAHFRFSNTETFPENYKIIFGSFNDDLQHPISSKVVSKPAEGEDITVSLINIPENATFLGLYLVHEYSNQKIYPFYVYPITKTLDEDIDLPLQNINLAVFGRIKKQVFSQCVQCHGGSGSAAAGLFLTDDKSYEMTVDVTAKRNAEKKRISPNNVQNSFLIDILKGEALTGQHSSLSSLKDDDITLIERWIKNGAENN